MWAITFDGTIHLSDILTTIIVPIMGYGALKVYTAVSTFVDRTDETADVVDVHTDVLTKAGWTRGMDIPKVGPRQRKKRTMFLGLAMLLAFASSASAQDVLPTLLELRPLYPTPMSKPQLSELLNRAALAHPGWRMLRKDSGNNCPTPNPAVHISCDWMFSPEGWGFDVIRDQEGVAAPGKFGDGPLQAGQELVVPWGADTSTPPSPSQPPVQVNIQPALDRIAVAESNVLQRIAEAESEAKNRADQTNQKVDGVLAAVDNPGWISRLTHNPVAQSVGAAVLAWATTYQIMKPK